MSALNKDCRVQNTHVCERGASWLSLLAARGRPRAHFRVLTVAHDNKTAAAFAPQTTGAAHYVSDSGLCRGKFVSECARTQREKKSCARARAHLPLVRLHSTVADSAVVATAAAARNERAIGCVRARARARAPLFPASPRRRPLLRPRPATTERRASHFAPRLLSFSVIDWLVVPSKLCALTCGVCRWQSRKNTCLHARALAKFYASGRVAAIAAAHVNERKKVFDKRSLACARVSSRASFFAVSCARIACVRQALACRLNKVQFLFPQCRCVMEDFDDFCYNKKDLIGHGAFAVVYKGRYKTASSHIQTLHFLLLSLQRDIEVAVKAVAKKNLSKAKNLLQKEIKILTDLKSLKHENLVSLLKCVETPTHVYLVMGK